MTILYVKALHIIFIVTWFAGLFYIVRLFLYHVEAEKKSTSEKEILQSQFKIMEKRLWYGIAWPSLVGTFIFGFWLVYLTDAYANGWFWLKMAFVFGLFMYHLQCGRIFNQLQNNVIKYSSLKLRVLNEVATLFLVSIVFIAVLRDTLNRLWGMIALVLFAGLMLGGILMYRKWRKE